MLYRNLQNEQQLKNTQCWKNVSKVKCEFLKKAAPVNFSNKGLSNYTSFLLYSSNILINLTSTEVIGKKVSGGVRWICCFAKLTPRTFFCSGFAMKLSICEIDWLTLYSLGFYSFEYLAPYYTGWSFQVLLFDIVHIRKNYCKFIEGSSMRIKVSDLICNIAWKERKKYTNIH